MDRGYIEEFIGHGFHNRTSRAALKGLLGQSDRRNRIEIHQALDRDVLICGSEYGGYFIPDPNSLTDVNLARDYVWKELSRARTQVAYAKKRLELLKNLESKIVHDAEDDDV